MSYIYYSNWRLVADRSHLSYRTQIVMRESIYHLLAGNPVKGLSLVSGTTLSTVCYSVTRQIDLWHRNLTLFRPTVFCRNNQTTKFRLKKCIFDFCRLIFRVWKVNYNVDFQFPLFPLKQNTWTLVLNMVRRDVQGSNFYEWNFLHSPL